MGAAMGAATGVGTGTGTGTGAACTAVVATGRDCAAGAGAAASSGGNPMRLRTSGSRYFTSSATVASAAGATFERASGAVVPGHRWPVASTARRFASLWQSSASATSVRPIARNSRASRRRTHAWSTSVVPPVAPKPGNDTPTLTEPMQVSDSVVVSPGAWMAGFVLIVCVPE
ncbi:hypothetical protein FEQ04_00580 [Burkholderia pseudomultivorans]|nr:hypothetical protein [Burkholderia pseudomultivorans]